MALYTDSESAQIGITIMFAILVTANLAGNTMVCLIILIYHDMRTPMNFLLLNLAIADMIVALFVAPRFLLSHLFAHPDGKTGTIFCKLLTGGNLTWTGGAASVFTLVVIAFERYYAVMYPYGNKGKLTYAKLMILVPIVWISAAVLNIPLFLTIFYDKSLNFCMEYWPNEWLPKAYSSTWFFAAGIIPIVLMSVLYSRVVYSLWFKQEERISRNTNQGVVKVRKRVTKMVLSVSIIYGLCWMPNLSIYALNYFSPSQNYGDVTYITSIVLVTCNSTVNPLIYVFVSQKFRRKIKRLLCCGKNCINRVGTTGGSSTKKNATQPTLVGGGAVGQEEGEMELAGKNQELAFQAV
ncbi:neuropeptide FF receptor 2-like [Montipora foliosa]|uniref:neuropeptide FF receptor 2-like n=1 Tax=Montipora foliosa TaxID=591990 RepID=UPI0035F1DA91